MDMYFKVDKPVIVAMIRESLEGQETFYKNLTKLEEKYGAETSHIFHSLQGGLSFSCLWFKVEDKEKIDTSLFKITYSVRNSSGEYGHEARPRKANKKFYAEFMQGIEDFSYLEFCKILFDVERIPYHVGIEFKERKDCYYIFVNRKIVIPHTEITATQYKEA